MKLTLQIESGRNRSGSEKPVVSDGWTVVVEAWRKANESGLDFEEKSRRLNWVGGALAMLAELTGENAAALRSKLELSHPPVSDAVQAGIPQFREGRSTPPPPRHPGAQTPVEGPSPQNS